MKSFDKIIAGILLILAGIIAAVNLYLTLTGSGQEAGREYRVEVNRIVDRIAKEGLESVDLSQYQWITGVSVLEEDRKNEREFFEGGDSEYLIREVSGKYYRIEYNSTVIAVDKRVRIPVNICLGIMTVFIIGIVVMIRQTILRPFATLIEVPYELSKGNLTVPIKENKSRFFGRFVWGMDLLRERLEQQKQRELVLQKEKKTLVLSISHDIKTPLSAIKLYAKALSKGLYTDKEKQKEIAGNIDAKADEIESFVSQIIHASSEELFNPEVVNGEYYLSELMTKIKEYYDEKLELLKINFSVAPYSDCILRCDLERSVEVLQNVMENALKYGNGHDIAITFSQEEDCRMITVCNSGCTLAEHELPNIFDSFWRGSNVGNHQGSGLGLYISRELMRKMGGEIFAEIQQEIMCVTMVFPIA